MLISAAKKGDQEAFSAIVNSYSRRVYAAAYSVLRNREDSADIVQEVFIRAHRNLSAFDSTRPFYPWLYKITKNLCLNKIKKNGKIPDSLPEWEIVSKIDGPETELTRTQELQEISRAIASLPEKFKHIIELKYFQECSYMEMSQILGVPLGTIMSRLYNARQKLKEQLSRED